MSAVADIEAVLALAEETAVFAKVLAETPLDVAYNGAWRGRRVDTSLGPRAVEWGGRRTREEAQRDVDAVALNLTPKAGMVKPKGYILPAAASALLRERLAALGARGTLVVEPGTEVYAADWGGTWEVRAYVGFFIRVEAPVVGGDTEVTNG